MTHASVAVIGAGVAGLATAKSLCEEGLQPTVFEKSSHLGGLWHYDDDAPAGAARLPVLQTNISRQAMGYSDHPIPDSFPDFPSHRQILEYLESYARRFELHRYIRLQHEVVSARPAGDQWELVVRAAGEEQTHRFDALVVCSGRHQTPRWADLEGRDGFLGEVVHSMSYAEPTPYAGRSVLIIGVGSTGTDLAEELAPVARRTLLSTAHGAWFIPRTIQGRPFDHNVTRLGSYLPDRLRQRVFRRLVEGEFRGRGIDLASCRMPRPRFDLRRARLTPSKTLVRLIAEGAVEVVPEVRRLDRDVVELADGRREAVDVIISATGYEVATPFLEPGLVAQDGRAPRLYKHVFAPGLRNLAFVGVPWVIGAYPPVLELQARWAARVFAGRSSLPAAEVLETRIERAVRRARAKRVDFDRVQPIEYMDDLAREIGCHPRLWRHPRLLIPLLTGPFRAIHYRLDGPGRLPGAAGAITRAAKGRSG